MLNKVVAPKADLPEGVRVKLQEQILAEPSAYGVYGVGFGFATAVLWLRTHDSCLVALATLMTILSISRMILTLILARLNSRNGVPNIATCSAIIVVIGGMLSSILAALAIRAAYLEDAVSIEVTAIGAATAVIGFVSRGAGIFPRATIAHSSLLFGPLIAAALAAGTLESFFVGVILTYFLVVIARTILVVHERLKAQVLAEYHLSLVARTDHLTGLANRAGFEERGLLAVESARSALRGCVVAIIDLDGFKAVNDTYGHGAGDDLLKEIAIRIKETLRARHFPVRLGGDEFAVLFDPDINFESAIALGEQIVTALKTPHKFGVAELKISGSVGLACLDNEADTFSSVVERADKALYQAKNEGKDQVRSLRSTEPRPYMAPKLEEIGIGALDVCRCITSRALGQQSCL